MSKEMINTNKNNCLVKNLKRKKSAVLNNNKQTKVIKKQKEATIEESSYKLI
jgi:hypothetical protein